MRSAPSPYRSKQQSHFSDFCSRSLKNLKLITSLQHSFTPKCSITTLVHSRKCSRFTITSLNMWHACIFGLLFSMGLHPRYVTVKVVCYGGWYVCRYRWKPNMGDINLICRKCNINIVSSLKCILITVRVRNVPFNVIIFIHWLYMMLSYSQARVVHMGRWGSEQLAKACSQKNVSSSVNHCSKCIFNNVIVTSTMYHFCRLSDYFWFDDMKFWMMVAILVKFNVSCNVVAGQLSDLVPP